jgi:rfaE bifunctional protein nucleotidyltransferase chain/domain
MLFEPVAATRTGVTSTKIQSLESLADLVSSRKQLGQRVGLCHGCFDPFHHGHLAYFEAAREQCDVLLVTVTPDQFVNKGPRRPVFNAHIRARVLAALEVIDAVGINHWPTAVELIRLLQPSCFIKGADYLSTQGQANPAILAERAAVEAAGGQMVFTRAEGFSSTRLLEWYATPRSEARP